MKKLLSLLTLSVLPFAIGCSDDVSTTGAEETDAKARVTLVVQGVDNALLDSVKVVELASKDKKTTKNGRAMFDDLSVGLHRFTLSRDGYATLIVDVDVSVDATTASMDETAIVRDQDHIAVRMSRATASARGRVLRDGASVGEVPSLVPVKGATVHLYAEPDTALSGRPTDQFGHPFYHYETTTDSDGVYLFEGLPEAARYSARAEHRIDLEHVWRATAVRNSRELLDDGVEVFEDMVLALDLKAADDSLILVSNNVSGRYLAPSDSVVLVFNRTINKDDQWASGASVLTMGGDLTRIATAVTVDGNKLVAKPALGTSWQNNSCYAVVPADLADQTGLKYNMTVTQLPVFCVLKDSKVSGFEFDSAFTSADADAYNENDCLKKDAVSARFNWTPSAHPGELAIGVYELYVSKNEGKDFVLDQTIQMAEGDTLVTATVALDPAMLDVDKVAFQVRSCTRFSATFFGYIGLQNPAIIDPCGAFLAKAVELDVCDD